MIYRIIGKKRFGTNFVLSISEHVKNADVSYDKEPKINEYYSYSFM